MIGSISNSGFSAYSGMRGMQGPDASQMQQKMFSQVDGDGSGGISKTEMSSFLQNVSGSSDASGSVDTLFENVDSDGDGSLSQSETTAAAQSLLSALQNQSTSQAGGPPPGPPPGGMGGMGGMDGAGGASSSGDMFSRIDTDGDGSISESELTTMVSSGPGGSGEVSTQVSDILGRDDADSDGAISESEFTAAMENMRSQGGPGGPRGSPAQSDSTSGASRESMDVANFIAGLLKQYTASTDTTSALLNVTA